MRALIYNYIDDKLEFPSAIELTDATLERNKFDSNRTWVNLYTVTKGKIIFEVYHDEAVAFINRLYLNGLAIIKSRTPLIKA